MNTTTLKARLRPLAVTAAAVVATAVVSDAISSVRARRSAVAGYRAAVIDLSWGAR